MPAAGKLSLEDSVPAATELPAMLRGCVGSVLA